jgi:hypothetical protein
LCRYAPLRKLAIVATLLLSGAALFAADKPIFLYSRHYNAKGENRYEADTAFKDVLTKLKADFDVRVHDKPLTRENLKDVRVVMIANPSDKAFSNNPAPPHFSAKDITTIAAWVREGGGLIISGNQEDHNLDIEDTNKLLSNFGLQFTNVYTDVKSIAVPKSAPIIGGLRWAFFSGNQVLVDSKSVARPKAVVTNDATSLVKGTRNPPGILMAVSQPDKGRVVAFTDNGWLINEAFTGGIVAETRIPEQDNWEIFHRLAKWAAGER